MKKNILLITSDQHHFSCMGYHHRCVKTPHLDRLAARGMIFDRAYCPNPTCTPTRASIITGRYPSQHGAYSLGTKLSEDAHVVGDDFTAAGYRTALVGKAHFQPLRGTDEFPSLEAYPVLQDLAFWRNFKDRFYGFDDVELARNHTDEAHVGQHYALWMEEKGFKNWRDHFQQPTGTREAQRYAWSLPEAYHYDAWIAECAALAVACGFPVRDSMINDNTGVVFGRDQYAAFENGMWSHEPYEVSASFDAINEPAVDGLPKGGLEWAEFGGLCEKLIIVHPGKFCSAHLH